MDDFQGARLDPLDKLRPTACRTLRWQRHAGTRALGTDDECIDVRQHLLVRGRQEFGVCQPQPSGRAGRPGTGASAADRSKNWADRLANSGSLVLQAEEEGRPNFLTSSIDAGLVGDCVVFNIGGNKFRLITKINYQNHHVFVRAVLTHKEYDEGKGGQTAVASNPLFLGRSMQLLNKRQQDTYLKLVQELPLVSIKTEEHLHAAQEMIDRLTNKNKFDGGEQAYLDAICDLVVVYEGQHHPIPMASDADLLRHLMEAKGVTQIQIHRVTGLAKSVISEVLAGKKPFSKTMIGTLATHFHVPSSVLAANIGKK